ncbi:HEAT repeat domain-containing protein [Corallococcus coralloides]|nr:HEAT repeat domain-containing protein [Corallococcus coralloides]
MALDLVFVRQRCTAIVIEPPSQEDIEATLGVSAEKTPPGAIPDPVRLQIQIKRRRTGVWTSNDFQRLLSGEPRKRRAASRASPLENLKTQGDLFYRLVTDAAVAGSLKGFTVEALDMPGRALNLPGLRRKSEQTRSQASRVGILEQMTQIRLQMEIEKILSQRCRVPASTMAECQRTLLDAVESRVADDRPDTTWSREELVEIILRHDGRLDDAPLPQGFVPPLRYSHFRGRLEDSYRLLLLGPSGLGKTTTAAALAHEHARASPPFEIIRRKLTPGEVRQHLTRPGRMLFLLEDPWGIDRPADDAQLWTNELPRLFAEARCDKRFLVTSRDGLFNTAMRDQPPTALLKAREDLNVAGYDAEARWAILRGTLAGGEDWQLDFISHHRESILAKLTVPLALSFFGEKVRDLPRPEDGNIDRLIHESLTESIGQTVFRTAAELPPEEVAAVTIVRALVRTNQGVTEEEARAASRRHPPTYRHVDVLKALRWLKRARWLKERAGRLHAHPLVLEGLARLMEEQPADCEGALLGLIEGLVSHGEPALAHRIVVTEELGSHSLPTGVRSALDGYLLDSLHQSVPEEFFQRFDTFARHTTASTPEAWLARAFIHGESRGGQFDRWKQPTWSESEWNEVRRSEAARTLARNFVRHVLPKAPLTYDPDSFLAFLRHLGWDLSEAFRETARSVLGTHASTHDVIFEGALSSDTNAFDELLRLLLAKEAEAFSTSYTPEERARYERACEEVLDAGEAELVHHDNSDIVFSFDYPIRHLLRARRRAEGYGWLLQHPQKERLWTEWGEVLGDEPPGTVAPGELMAFLEGSPDFALSQASSVISVHPSPELTHPLLQRLRTASLAGTRWCIEALCALHSPREIEGLLRSEGPPFSFVQRASMVTAAKHIQTWKKLDAAVLQQAFTRLLATDEQAVLDAIEAGGSTNPFKFKAPEFSAHERGLLEDLARHGPERIAVGATYVLAALGASIDEFAPRMLASDQPETRHTVLKALWQTGQPGNRNLLRAALSDRNYKCRIVALVLLARDASPQERVELLEKGEDASAPVREACASVIGTYAWEDGLDLLCTLLADRRNFSASPLTSEPPAYKVARAAADALARFSQLPSRIVEHCLRSLKRSWTQGDDFHVPVRLIRALSSHPGDDIRQMLEERLDSEGSFTSERGVAFPLRYAAAWGLVRRLEEQPDERDKVSVPTLRRAAGHSNSWLAAPAILALAFCTPKLGSEVRQWLGCRTTTPERTALWAAALAYTGRTIPRALLNKHLLQGHPFWLLLQRRSRNSPFTLAEWKLLLQQEPALAEWLVQIRPDEDVNACLRRMLSLLVGLQVEELKHDDLRFDILPPPSNWLSLRLMTAFR